MSSPASNDSACPKCGHAGATAGHACPRCGLVFTRWTAEMSAVTGWAVLDGQAETLWAEVQAAWSEPAKHDAFVTYCSQTGLLGPAGRRYREHVDRDPNDQTAKRMREKIVKMASVAFAMAARSKSPAAPTQGKWFWVVVALSMAVGVMAVLLRSWF